MTSFLNYFSDFKAEQDIETEREYATPKDFERFKQANLSRKLKDNRTLAFSKTQRIKDLES